MSDNGRTLYFAYGSNLSKERLSVSCPSAKLSNVARLENYKLSFFGHSSVWGGAGASIELSVGAYCWGAVWSVSNDELVMLDKQEKCGHPEGYTRVNVEVYTESNEQLNCLSYEIKDKSKPALPSAPYKEIIVRGALECCLPQHYTIMLQGIKHNGYHGEVNYRDHL